MNLMTDRQVVILTKNKQSNWLWLHALASRSLQIGGSPLSILNRNTEGWFIARTLKQNKTLQTVYSKLHFYVAVNF